MNKLRNISDRFKNAETVFSVEFFPPKTEEGARQILRTAKKLKELSPDYASITYGAGGSTRERTVEYGELLKDIFDFEIMPHLTCFGHSKGEIKSIADRFYKTGFRNIMALRGDPPKGESTFVPHPDGFKYANELVEYLRKSYSDIGIGCAGYPEKHPEAPSMQIDIDNLKRKVDAGADFIVTQLFFENSSFFRFVESCQNAGIDKPIIAGLLPALSLKQLMTFKTMCSTQIPSALIKKFSDAPQSDSAEIGLDWAKSQIEELKANNVPGIHLYILNRASSALKLSETIRR